MNPARWPRRMPPRPPFEGRYPASTHQPPEAATRNNPPVNRGPQPSRGNLLLAPRHSPLNHTYLLPVQSHPHSTVLPLLTAKLRQWQSAPASTDKSRASTRGVFGFRLILILIHRHDQFPPPQAIRLPNLHLIFPNLLIPEDIS